MIFLQIAHNVLKEWETEVTKFILVFPVDYKRALAELAMAEEKIEDHSSKETTPVHAVENGKTSVC